MHLVRVAAGMAVLLAATAPGAAAPRSEDPSRQICKSKPAVGSRLKRIRECHSAAEWEDMKLAEQIGLRVKQYNGDETEGFNEFKVRGGFDTPR